MWNYILAIFGFYCLRHSCLTQTGYADEGSLTPSYRYCELCDEEAELMVKQRWNS